MKLKIKIFIFITVLLNLSLTEVYRAKILEVSIFDFGQLTLSVHRADSSAHDGFGRVGG